MRPRDDLHDELSETEGEPSSPDACMDVGDMPTEHGKTLPVQEGWRHLLLRAERGRDHAEYTKAIAANVVTILRHHPVWRGVLAYDEFSECLITTRAPRWNEIDTPPDVSDGVWSDNDTGRLATWLARAEFLDVPTAEIERGLAVAGDTERRHPVREYLRGLAWDGTPRVDGWLSTYLGTSDGLYEQGVGSRWLLSAIARVIEPGCQADSALILEGPQGIGKTSALRALVPVEEWYADSGLDVGNKDSCDALRSVWIYGLDELDSLRRGEVTRWKTFLSQTRDHYRPPYARRTRDFRRQNVFCGTTNELEYLVDPTGGRRFWPVRVGRVSLDALRRDRDQLWAEAFARFVAGERWHIDTPGLRQLAEAQQAYRLQVDPWESIVLRWLERPLVTGEDGHPELARLEVGVSAAEVLEHAVRMRPSDMARADVMRISSILLACGLVRERRSVDGLRGWTYRRPVADVADVAAP